MATYNSLPYLEEAIRSILNQSFDNFEFIIVDDGSVDGTREVLMEYASREPRIRLAFQQHSGVITALNKGCSLARGQYIARLDSDDVAKPQRFEEQIGHMQKKHNTALLGGWVECIDREGKVLFTMRWPDREGGLHDYLLLDCYISHTTVMFKKEVFLSVGGYRSSFQDAEDYDLFLRISDRYVVDNLPMILCQYRLHDNQISVRNAHQQIISGIGARMATRARRTHSPEPTIKGCPVTREDLIAWGIRGKRIDALVADYDAGNIDYAHGWRWAKSHFCQLATVRDK
jgi:glycosyltransferase involved in cell wall biosynthesis